MLALVDQCLLSHSMLAGFSLHKEDAPSIWPVQLSTEARRLGYPGTTQVLRLNGPQIDVSTHALVNYHVRKAKHLYMLGPTLYGASERQPGPEIIRLNCLWVWLTGLCDGTNLGKLCVHLLMCIVVCIFISNTYGTTFCFIKTELDWSVFFILSLVSLCISRWCCGNRHKID